MFRTIEDFQKQWAYETDKTLGILKTLPTDRLAFPAGDAHRSLGRLAWHLVESAVELPEHLGLTIDGPRMNPDGFIGTSVPATAEAIAKEYEKVAASVAKQVGFWKDADLTKEDSLYGETWQRGYSLFVLVVHQAHHRGQMTVLMRQAGLVVPEVYGPTREMWAAYGKPVPAV